jgi:hypothetical protein
MNHTQIKLLCSTNNADKMNWLLKILDDTYGSGQLRRASQNGEVYGELCQQLLDMQAAIDAGEGPYIYVIGADRHDPYGLNVYIGHNPEEGGEMEMQQFAFKQLQVGTYRTDGALLNSVYEVARELRLIQTFLTSRKQANASMAVGSIEAMLSTPEFLEDFAVRVDRGCYMYMPYVCVFSKLADSNNPENIVLEFYVTPGGKLVDAEGRVTHELWTDEILAFIANFRPKHTPSIAARDEAVRVRKFHEAKQFEQAEAAKAQQEEREARAAAQPSFLEMGLAAGRGGALEKARKDLKRVYREQDRVAREAALKKRQAREKHALELAARQEAKKQQQVQELNKPFIVLQRLELKTATARVSFRKDPNATV